MKGTIYYIRHGQASLFSDNYDQLSDLGRAQARAIGRFLHQESVPIDRVFVGPLDRHHQTYEEIRKTWKQDSSVSVQEDPGLREHQGYAILQQVLPQCVEEDVTMKNLVSQSFSTDSEKVKYHIAIFDHFIERWILGKYDHLIPPSFQAWHEFKEAAIRAFKNITRSVNTQKNALVVTSVGPKSVTLGSILGYEDQQIARLSSTIHNASISTVRLRENSWMQVDEMNSTRHFDSQDMVTLV